MTEPLPNTDHCADHRAAMVMLARHCMWRTGAEVGAGGGHLSRRLLTECEALYLVAVDACYRQDRQEKLRATRRDWFTRYTLLEMKSVEAAAVIPDASLDFAFIDAGHGYRAVHDDIRAWREKVRPDGWLLGHDYGHSRYPGVARAVDEWFGRRVQLVGHTIWAVPGSLIHAPAEPVR